MTKEELKRHCELQIAGCEMWAKANEENPHGKVYEEHKLILELLDENKLLVETLNECSRKKGKWENGNPICPCCGEDKFKDLDADIWADWQPKYCPNCGSLMMEVKEN